MPNNSLEKYLKKRINQPTVILCFKILLENVIKFGGEHRMSKSDINKSFDDVHNDFGVQNFRSDYLLRQSGNSPNNAIGIDDDGKRFFLKPEFLTGTNSDELKSILERIESHFVNIAAERQGLYTEVLSAQRLPVKEKRGFIEFMLLKRETDRKGQCFEVTAFAILKTFYSIRGFELNRFSTIYANDGGVDYASQTSVYQVTTKLSNKKFEEDILKAPLKKRIFVYRESVPGFDFTKMDNKLVSDYLDANDLLQHLDYLLSKKATTNSNLILEVIIEEFQREYYL